MTYKPKTYKSGYLKRKEHQIYYELAGNPNGKPILFVHGGPGGGFSKYDKRFFNPKKFNLILFDQRGCGKSKPFASLKNNTTPLLVEDMKALLDHLKIKKTFIFGGSWGSTLSLAYAVKYPKTLLGMVIRGIYLGSKEDDLYFTYEARNNFPEEWKKLTSVVPEKYIKRKKIEKFYYKKCRSKNKKEALKYTKKWAEYEASISSLRPHKKLIQKFMKQIKHETLAKIELHYFNNNCFMSPQYLLKNCHKIKCPVSIIHGRYDSVCSLLNAYLLNKAISKSKLIITISGHSSYDPENEKALIKETNKLTN